MIIQLSVCGDEIINRSGKEGVILGNELDSMCGISDEELTERFKQEIRIENEMKKIKGTPIAGYDIERKQAYLEFSYGRRRYAGEK